MPDEMVSDLLQDLRYGARTLSRNRGFTAVAVLCLALGIGANTAMFTVVDAVLFRPLPYAEPDRIVRLWERTPPPNPSFFAIAPANFLDWKEQNQVFEDLAAIASIGVRPVATGFEEPERLRGNRVSESFFRVMGVGPALGRSFLPEEDRPDGDPVVILNHSLWRRWFNEDPDAVGSSLTLGGVPHTIVGVMPAGFSFVTTGNPHTEADLWFPYPFADDPPYERGVRRLSAVARLAQGVSLEQARAEMDAIAERLAEAYPAANGGRGILVKPLHGDLVEGVRSSLLLLFGAVGFVLLISCVNVANLFLARSLERHREIAVRAALGAGRLRLVLQLVTEGALLATLGGAFGLLLARWGVSALLARSPAGTPRLEEVGIDGRVLGFTVLTCVMTLLLFGLLPALRGSNAKLSEALKEGAMNAGGGRQRGRSLLVVAEVALALVLFIGAGLVLNTFVRLQATPLGFDPLGLTVMEVDLPSAKYADPVAGADLDLDSLSPQEREGISQLNYMVPRAEQVAFVNEVVARLQALPGVESAGAVNYLPVVLGGGVGVRLTVDDAPPSRPNPLFRPVTPGYFRTMGIPLVRGRPFTAADDEDAPAVAIASAALAERYWPDGDPLGRRVEAWVPGAPVRKTFEIVGLVGDVRQMTFHQAELQMELEMGRPRIDTLYIPYRQQPDVYVDFMLFHRMNVNFVARATVESGEMAMAMRSTLWDVDPDQPITRLSSMEQYVADTLTDRRFSLAVLGTFSAVALLLAAIGIYGMIAYSVNQRTHEIGVRIALGARPASVVKMVVGRGLALATAGVVVGVAGALGLTRLLTSWLWDVSPTDPATFFGTSVTMIIVALAACLVPAWRATRVDPVESLRSE